MLITRNYEYDYNKRKNELNLAYRSITDEVLITSIVPFINKHNISTVNLRGNYIGTKGVRALAQTHIKNLNLESNQIGSDGAKELAVNQSIEVLNLRSNNIGLMGVKALATCFNLRELNLSQNKLGDNVKVLATNISLKKLILKYNDINDESAVAFAQNYTLEELDLAVNNIGRGASAFKNNKKLKRLSLKANNLSDEEAIQLSESKTLVDLDVSLNYIGDEGALKLAAANFSMLNLRENNVSEQCEKEIIKLTADSARKVTYKLQFFMQLEVPSLLSLSYFKMDHALQNNDFPFKNLFSPFEEFNESFSKLIKNILVCETEFNEINDSYEEAMNNSVISEQDSEFAVEIKINTRNAAHLSTLKNLKLLKEKLELISKSIDELCLAKEKITQVQYDKQVDCKIKMEDFNEKIEEIILGISLNRQNERQDSDPLKKHFAAHRLHKIDGDTFATIKNWVLYTSYRYDCLKVLIKRSSEAKDLTISKKATDTLSGISSAQNLHELTLYISPKYKTMCSPRVDIPLNKPFFLTPLEKALESLEDEFLSYLKKQYNYKLPKVQISRNEWTRDKKNTENPSESKFSFTLKS